MKYSLKFAIGITQIGLLIAQDAEYRPAHAASDAIVVDGNSVEVETVNPEDFFPAENGKLSLANALDVAQIKTAMEASLAKVPGGEKGQGHNQFAACQQLVTSFQNIVTTKNRESLLATIPVILPLFSASVNRGYELNYVVEVASRLRHIYIPEVAFDILENSAMIPQLQHDRFVNLFCNSTIMQPTDWEDDPPPIDEAGVFIVDANSATTSLKSKSLEEIKFFLGGTTDNSFFKRYEATGDGMGILKTKYAANKELIHKKLAEVMAHAATLEKSK